MSALLTIKNFFKVLPTVLGMVLVALFFIVRGQRDAARSKASQAKTRLQTVNKVRQIEHDMATNQTQARDESKAESRRQKAYRDRGERPEYFGDDRLR